MELKSLADEQARVKDFPGAAKTVASITDPKAKDGAFQSIATMEAVLGAFTAAAESASEIKDSRVRAEVLRTVSGEEVEVGDRAAALRELGSAIKAIAMDPEQSYRVESFRDIGHLQGRLGAHAASISTFRRALASSRAAADRARVLLDLVAEEKVAGKEQSSMGQIREALLLVSALEDSSVRASLLIEVGGAQLGIGQRVAAAETMRGALRSISRLGDSQGERDEQLRSMAVILVKTGAVPMALQIAAGIGDLRSRENYLATVAEAQVKTGDEKGALRTAAALEDDYKEELWVALAGAEWRAGENAKAVRTAERIQDSAARCIALDDIGVNQANAGDSAAALATWRKALAAAASVDALLRPGLLRKLVEDFSRTGDIETASRAAKSIPDTSPHKTEVLYQIATAQAAAGRPVAAAATLQVFLEHSGGAAANAGVIRGFAALKAAWGDVDGALSWSAARASPCQRTYGFLGVAEGRLGPIPSVIEPIDCKDGPVL
ncbi:MAG TPA: hypothetical protein VN999_06145 [Thermoanaerobaculia bacterium]|nr:hypothetical protein [Thermoanaerobaculia bacterium]